MSSMKRTRKILDQGKDNAVSLALEIKAQNNDRIAKD